MLGKDVGSILIALGILLFIFGWVLILSNNGVSLQTCSTYVSVPSRFEGAVSFLGNYTQYKAIFFARIRNVSIEAGTKYRYSFSLNSTAVSPFLMQYNLVSSSSSVNGSITLLDSKNTSLAYIPLQYSTPVVADQRFVTSVPSLPPGTYAIEISAGSTSFRVVSFNISALTYESSPSIKFDLTPSSWDQREIKYVCGVDTRGLFVAAALIGFGIGIISFVAVDAYRSAEISRVKIPLAKSKGKKK